MRMFNNSMLEYSHGNKSKQKYYSGFMDLWTEFKEFVYTTVSDGLPTLQKYHEDTQRVQFLMKLHEEYEIVRTTSMSWVPTPSLVDCLGELLQEEQCL